MEKPPPNLMQYSSINPYKSNEYPQKVKGMSFFAFIFSIFIYISIFYIFNLSPSALFNNTKFWFVISNTLILIIAADYGTFSASKHKYDDLYEDYVARSAQARRSVQSSFVSDDDQYPQIVKNSINPSEEVEKNEVIKEKGTEVIPEKVLEMVVKSEEAEKPEENFQEKVPRKENEGKSYGRSKSEKAKRVVIDGKAKVLRRVETEKYEQILDQENEFSTMSDEELNRRVEEFIQRFNRQI